jgi:mannobiose 2-epimerase
MTADKADLQMADRAFEYILAHFIDPKFGGVYWTVDAQGRPLERKKQVYALAFTLYAFSEYHQATGSVKAKEQAIHLFNTIEKYSLESVHGGYIEAFTEDWQPAGDLRLSEKDANERKTMNTHLHVLEAYASFYRVWPDKKLLQAIRCLLEFFARHIIDPATGHLQLFFTDNWTVKGHEISYGHDIEAAWLLLEAAETTGEEPLVEQYKKLSLQMTDAAAEGLDTDGGLWYEYDTATQQRIAQKHWWPQAEAMVGFVNAWQLSGRAQYLQQAIDSWRFIQLHIKDKQHGEWFWGVEKDYSVIPQDKLGLWKCPYHNARACMEIIRRIA